MQQRPRNPYSSADIDRASHEREDDERMLELADQRNEMQVEARCWCGERANNNARLVNGRIVYEGETVVVGDTDKVMSEPLFGDEVRYELLCRRHYVAGDIGPSK